MKKTILLNCIIFLLLVILIIADDQYPDASNPFSATHNYHFDNGSGTAAIDSIGSINGLLGTGMGWTPTRTNFGNAVTFDNTIDSNVKFDQSIIEGATNFTITFWVNQTVFFSACQGAQSNCGYFGDHDEIGDFSMHSYYPVGDGPFGIRVASANFATCSMNLAILEANVDGIWTHYGISYNSSHISLYFNGDFNQSCSGTYPAIGTSLDRNFAFGSQISNDIGFGGEMDDAVFIVGGVFSDEEINNIFTSTYPPGDITPDAPTYIFPTPGAGTLNNTNQTINLSCDPSLNYFLWFDNESSPSNIVLDNTTLGNYTTNVSIEQTYFYRGACLNITGNIFSVNSSLRNFTLDISTPTITINTNNFFNTTNRSTVNQYANGTVKVNITFNDNDNVFAILFNITKGGVIFFNHSNVSINEVSHNFTEDIDITTWEEGVYDIEVIVADGHHYVGGYKIGDYDIVKIPNKLIFDTTEGNTISVVGVGAYSTSYTRETNSYGIGFDYFLPSSTRTFYVEADNKIYYIEDSNYRVHFVVWNGVHGNWIDFEGLGGDYTVRKINDYKYEVVFENLPLSTKVITKSIGGLNVRTENYQWYRGIAIDTNPDLFTLEKQEFVLNMTINISFITNTNATLIYNNTLQELTRIIGSTFVSFNTTITVPDITQDTNISYFWNVTVNQTGNELYDFLIERNSSVENWGLDNCSLFATNAINFTIEDETNQTDLLGDASGTFNFTRDSINFRTFDLDVSGTSNFSICITPSDETFTVDYNLIYSAPTYSQRDFQKVGDVLTNATVKIPLFLLNSLQGIFQRFTVVDAFSNVLDGVRVTMSRVIAGITRTIEEKLTDDSGFARFFANPDETYTFTFSVTGFETKSFSLVPDSSEIRVVVMGEEAADEFTSTGTGIKYAFSPINTILNNNTNVTFTFNMSSSLFRITNCTLFLKNSSGAVLEQSSSSFNTTNCDIAILRNTGNLSFIKSEAQYTLNNTINETVSVQYDIRFTFKGNFSLMNFFDDLRNFGQSGFDDTTRMFIAFIVIFAIVGSVAFKLGLRDPESLVILTWSLVLFFSFLGWLTLGFDAIPNINPPGKAWIQQYIIFIIISLIAGGYVIKKHTD